MKTLLRLFSVLIAVGAAIATMVPASAATVDRSSMSGSGAEAFFSTCPTFPANGQVCTDTRIAVANQMTTAGGIKSSGTTLSIDQFSYGVDSTGNYFFISDTAGFGLASLSIDSRLTSATTTASFAVISCTVDTCTDGTVTVSASWTGQGTLAHQVGNMHFAKGSLTENFHYNGYFREASATASVNGIDMGASLYADMFNVKSAYVVICHMC